MRAIIPDAHPVSKHLGLTREPARTHGSNGRPQRRFALNIGNPIRETAEAVGRSRRLRPRIIIYRHSLPWPHSPRTARTTSTGHQFWRTGCTGDHRGRHRDRHRDRGSTNAKGGAQDAGMSTRVVSRTWSLLALLPFAGVCRRLPPFAAVCRRWPALAGVGRPFAAVGA